VELRLDAAKWRKRRGMGRLLTALGAEDGLSRYVGGAVRDELLDHPVNDVDIATRLRPDDVVKRLEAEGIRVIPTGIEHGTITAISSGQHVEITSLRRDVSTDGRRATVAFTDDWKEDAARRDFTINALLADPLTGEIFDYFGGIDDLHDRRVRFIGEPLERIAEDHLRILRFFRFHARFGEGDPDQAALEACSKRANDLMALSRERIADELLKLIGVEDPSPTVALMIDRGILKPVLPEIDAASVQRLELLVDAEREANIAPDPLRRLAALLPRNRGIAESVALRLRLSNKAKKRLGCTAEEGLGSSPEALAYFAGHDCATDRLLLAGKTDEAASLSSWTMPRLPIGGGALIERGMTPGPQVARTLKALEHHWVESGFPTGEEFERLVTEALESSKQV
jgi:poly(A) polymerase